MKKLLWPFGLLFIIAMLLFPQASFTAAQQGLALWWEIVVPSLLPFFIAAELLLAAGAAQDLGHLLSPLMRPLFRLPGEAALALVMGYSSGFPTGAAVTARLREKNLVTREEGERLLAFTNNASPLFISVSVATGLLGQPRLGLPLMLIHYGSNLLLGFLLRWRAPHNQLRHHTITPPQTLVQPFGALLKNSARKAGGNIAIIGCYLIFFSVLTEILAQCQVPQLLSAVFSLPPSVSRALSLGLWEMTLGVNALGDSALALPLQLPLLAALLAWGGLSVQAQVSAMVSHTDLSTRTYLLCRCAQAALSLVLALLLVRLWPFSSTAITTGITHDAAPAIPVIYNLLFLLPILALAAWGRIARLIDR